MWISKKKYDEMLNIINQQKKDIDDMKIERIKLNSRYMKAVDMLSGLIRWISTKPNQNIDFPNSEKGGFEGSDIFTM